MVHKANSITLKRIVISVILLALLSLPSSAATFYYCGECDKTWETAPSWADTCHSIWIPGGACLNLTHSLVNPVRHYYQWETTTSRVEGDPYDGTLKTFDDFRCKKVTAGVNPYTATYATESRQGAEKSVKHSWSSDIKFPVVKKLLDLSVSCATENSMTWHCDEGNSWSQPVVGEFKDGEYSKMYPRYIDTTITTTGPLHQVHFNLAGGQICASLAQGARTATKIEKAVAATFRVAKESAKCNECGVEDMWCNGTNCTTAVPCCKHYPKK